MILDYSEYTERCGSHGIVLYENVDTNRDLFYEQRQCPFCTDSQLERIHQREKKAIQTGCSVHLRSMNSLYVVRDVVGGNMSTVTKVMRRLMA